MMLSRYEISPQIPWKFFRLCDGTASTKCCLCPSLSRTKRTENNLFPTGPLVALQGGPEQR